MRITFNLQNVGAGNNGGTATLFHSANTLHVLGHQVRVVSDLENRFTWFGLNGPRFTQAYRDEYPNAEILVATGANSMIRVLEAPDSKGVKFWWIRAHEKWIVDSQTLLNRYKNSKIRKMTNSASLKGFIKEKTGAKAVLMRPGLDFNVFRPTRKRDWLDKKGLVIGALYTERPSKRFKWLHYILTGLQEKGIDCKLKIFGTWETPIGLEYDEYLERPEPTQLAQMYNEIDFWIAPTRLEGLHIPPQEAMLCGCVVIGAAGDLNGMNDYIQDGATGHLVDDPDEAISILKNFIRSEEGKKRAAGMSKAGMLKIRSFGDRKTNMQRMVKHFEKVIKKCHRKEKQ